MNTRKLGMYAGVALAVFGLYYVMKNQGAGLTTLAPGSILADITDPFAVFNTGSGLNPFAPVLPDPVPTAIAPASPIQAPPEVEPDRWPNWGNPQGGD